MSVDAGLFLRLVSSKGKVAVLEALLASNWKRHDDVWQCIPEPGDTGDWGFRVKLGDRASDVSWYLLRLLPLFTQQSGILVESWIWQETA
ncbi:MAG: hypothetical protein IPK82_06050 [Polyangiaceae bacterium]|nr:hypothetical protein [Polyangiaceae bacterium]